MRFSPLWNVTTTNSAVALSGAIPLALVPCVSALHPYRVGLGEQATAAPDEPKAKVIRCVRTRLSL